MGIAYNTNIVRSGLVLHLDAANIKSYPGSGTTWTDVSGNGNNGTLINSPTYNSANKGSIVLDGINDYIDIGANALLAFGTGNFTIQLAFNLNSIVTNQYLFDFGANNLALQYYNNSGYVIRYLTQLTSIKDTSYTLTTGVAYDLTVARNGTTGYLYLNGNQLNTWTDSDNYSANSPEIGRYGGSSAYLNAKVYSFKVYNRALTTTEIQKNFEATRGRYGI